MKKIILVISPSNARRILAMQRKFKELSGKATCRVTDGVIETDTETYIFRRPDKERIVGFEVSEIVFEDDVLVEDRIMVENYVRIKK